MIKRESAHIDQERKKKMEAILQFLFTKRMLIQTMMEMGSLIEGLKHHGSVLEYY